MNDKIKQRARELYANEWSKIDSHYAAGIRSGDILATPEIRAITAALNESAPKAEAQAAGDGVTFWLIVRNGDVEFGQDLADLPAPASHDAQQPPAFQRWSMTKGSDGARWSVYMDHDPCGEWVKWIEVQQHCFGMALAQQPAVVGDGVRSLPAEWRSTAARHRSRGTGQSVAQANGYDMAANMLEAALTPAATPGDDPVPWEWRWVDENDRAMTAWKRGDTPPMLDVSDSKGTMRVEVRIAQKEGNGNG